MKDIIITTFGLSTMILKGMLDGKSREDTLARTGNSNTIGWIIGHMIKSRGSVLTLLNKEYKEIEDENRYARGTTKDKSSKIIPEVALEVFEKRGRAIEKAIREADEKQLGQKIDFKLPGVGDTVRDALIFLAWHESFHAGQIDLILAALGKGGIK